MSGEKQELELLNVFISSLIKRIESFLPNVTGYSLIEVELNPQFTTTRNILIENSNFNDVDLKTQYISNCFHHLCYVLRAINLDSNDLKLRERDEKSLSSSLLVLRLLSDLIKHSWNSKYHLSNHKSENFSVNFEILSDYSFYYHFTPPSPLNAKFIEFIIDTLIDLLSPEVIKKVLTLIKKAPIDAKDTDNLQNLSLEGVNLNQPILSDSEHLINEIDLNIEICLRFIATSNPEEYFGYLNAKLFKFAKSHDTFPLHALQRYSPLIKYAFYSKVNAFGMAEGILDCLNSIKTNSWKQVCLVFYSTSIRDQACSRPEDYNNLVATSPELETICKSVFDNAASIVEEVPFSGVSSMMQSWLSVLVPSDYKDFEQKPNKLKVAFNKRLKFLNSLLKDSNSQNNLTCYDSLTNLFHLAGRFPDNIKSHPVYIFSINHLDETFNNLLKVHLYNSNHETTLCYDNLVINFFIAAILLSPDKYTKLILQKLHDSKDNLREVRIVIKVLKGLSELEPVHDLFYDIMKQISPNLKFMIYNASSIINQYYENIFHNSSSSSVSIHSEKLSAASSIRKLSFENELSPTTSRQYGGHYHSKSINEISSGTGSSGLDDIKSPSSGSLNNSTHKFKKIIYAEESLSDLFSVFNAAPKLYFNDFTFMNKEAFYNDEATLRQKISKFCDEIVSALRTGLHYKSVDDESPLFDSTCQLIMSLVDGSGLIAKNSNEVMLYANYLTSNNVIKAICDSCLSLSLTDSKFKSNFLFLNKFLEGRDKFSEILTTADIVKDPRTHDDDQSIVNSIERVLLLSLCTHDIQFYNIAKDTMKWHIKNVNTYMSVTPDNINKNLCDTFEKIINDDFVFTGFVSLHKRFRNILRSATPTTSLYDIWVLIYERWLILLSSKNNLNEENLLFRHFTGFLVSTSGCFLLINFGENDSALRVRLESYISEFFDKCIDLLNSQDLVVRVIIKDALSNESHSAVYQLICNKMCSLVNNYEENKIVTQESTLFTEQAIVILTAMLGVHNDGAVVLTTLLPEMCQLFIKLINLTDDSTDGLRLKLRFCKLAQVLELNRSRLLLSGGHKVRNHFAKGVCDWLEQSAFFDEISYGKHNTPSASSKSNSKDSELIYINIDLATESSKALALQLEELVLEIPDNIVETEVAKYKDLAFGNYFSLFYKILTKYTSMNLNSNAIKSKYKVQMVTENVLKCITNLLQYDSDIGLQFVFPLGYHENDKIRSLFLSVFADMLYERKSMAKTDEYVDETLARIPSIYDVFGAVAKVSSSNNHNLLASSIFGVAGHYKFLDKVYHVLLKEEINNVSRTSDIFRRNSTLTKLLSKVAKDYGLEYLSIVLKPFMDEFTSKEINFEVDKSEEGVDLFLTYLNKLVDAIVNSEASLPKCFRFTCAEVLNVVTEKFEDAGLIAVGSFIFLRFFCPAVISPETFFDIDVISNNNKKSLLQLVKVIQNMANGSLHLLRWKSLNDRIDELNEINSKIFDFLKRVSVYESNEYPFDEVKETPIAELRYLHKFFFNFYKDIKKYYLVSDDITPQELSKRISVLRQVDTILKSLGQPKSLVSFQLPGTASTKNFDPSGNLSNEYNEFMNRMSSKYGDRVVEMPLIHNAIFHDGTPVVVVNLGNLRFVEFDVHLLIYKLFETASQVWDNVFYFVFDFTEFSTEIHLLLTYATLLNTYSPIQLFQNCARIYYFNIPRGNINMFFDVVKPSNIAQKERRAKIYTYSHCDSIEIISGLCLSEQTMAITRDKKVEFNHCKVLNSSSQTFFPATVKIGRQFILVCNDEFVPTAHELVVTKGFRPVEIYSLGDITRCEITKNSGASDEFTVYLNNDQSVIIRSPERLEILRFLYFTTSRVQKQFVDEDDKGFQGSVISNLWFGRLFNIVFQGLLCEDGEVRSSASLLFASVTNYFDIDFNISKNHAKDIAYPANTTDFIVSVCEHLSINFPEMSYRFFRAFFDSYEKLPARHRMNAILYVTPWIRNICNYIYLDREQNGPDRVAGIIRQFCSISAMNKQMISAINDYIWKKLFSDTLLAPILLDEIVNFAMDNRNDDPDWDFIISVVSPSVEMCGEAISRLIACVNQATSSDSEIASESKLFEILVLVKICASLFFDSYVYAQLYLADVFFLCTLFIDNRSLDFGGDLQKLVINTVQSFLHKPDLTEREQTVVEETLTYFSGQRARMLFGMTREKSSTVSELSQLYNRASSFETLCDYLNEFIAVLGSADERSGWRSRWCSYSIDIAFASSSLFQVRAILVVGILSKSGINDHTASKLFKLMSHHPSNNSLEYMVTILISASKICKGLSPSSVFPPIIIWPQFCLGLLEHSSLYQAGIQCLLNTLMRNFDQGPRFWERIMAHRQYLTSFIESFEKDHDFHITEQNILCYIFFIFTQGLKLSHVKHISLDCLQRIFRERYDREIATEPTFEIPSGTMPYLFFIWLNVSDSAFEEYLSTTRFKPKKWIHLKNGKIPATLIDFLVTDALYAQLVIHLASYFFASDSVESGFKTRFIYVYDYLFSIRRELGLRVYHIIKPSLENTMINSNSTQLVEIVSDILIKILRDKDFSMEQTKLDTHKLLKDNHLTIIALHNLVKFSDMIQADEGAEERIARDNEQLLEMVYRSASCYVDGERLED